MKWRLPQATPDVHVHVRPRKKQLQSGLVFHDGGGVPEGAEVEEGILEERKYFNLVAAPSEASWFMIGNSSPPTSHVEYRCNI